MSLVWERKGLFESRGEELKSCQLFLCPSDLALNKPLRKNLQKEQRCMSLASDWQAHGGE